MLQRVVGGLLEAEGKNPGNIGQLLGPDQDVLAEIISTENGRRASVVLLDPQMYGFENVAAIELRGIEGVTPRFIVTTDAASGDRPAKKYDVVDPAERIRIADTISAIVMKTTKPRRVGTLDL
jgi:hypothetical protein